MTIQIDSIYKRIRLTTMEFFQTCQNTHMKKITLFTLITMIILACSNNEQPRIVYNNNKDKPSEEKQDSFLMQVMDLPIQFEDTDVLLHPIGELVEYGSGGYRKMSISSSGVGTKRSYLKSSISSQNKNFLNGDIKNIKFEHAKEGTVNNLTDKNILINRVTFLQDLHKKTGKQLLVYAVYDKDTNGNQALDTRDLNSLYISRIDGTGFQKLNEDNHELVKWKVLDSTEKLYFRTATDTNRNGKFDKGDAFHNYQVDLNSSDNFTAEKYTFLD